MALRTIRTYKEDVLRKKSRPVDVVNNRIRILVQDMLDTMYEAEGVGLAAPQIGILKRVIVVDIGEGPVALINPELLSAEGSNIDEEGCLSIPGEFGKVDRPQKVKVKGLNPDGVEVVIEAEDFFARALCHEIDHLNGVLFTDKVIESGEE